MRLLNFINKGGDGGERLDGLKGLVFRNLGLKVLALIFSIALWYLVVGEKAYEVGLLVPLGFLGIPVDMIVVDKPPLDIEVRVAGPKGFIDNLSPTEVSASIDLSNAKEGLNTYRLLPHNIKTPSGIKVISVRPSSLDINLERLVRATLPVRAKVTGAPPPGYRVAEVVVTPQKVTVLGRRKSVKRLKGIQTTPVDITGLTSTVTRSVLVDMSEKGLTDVEPDTVDVVIRIEKIEKQG